MKRVLSLFLCVLSLSCAAQYQPETLAWGDFGNTIVYNGGTKGVELLLTDNQHQPQAKLFAEQLSQQGNLSAVLNMDSYITALEQRHATCFDAATPLSVYAQDLQQRHRFPHFTQAFITGFGTAGHYLYAMLSQIPKGMFRGAYSINLETQFTLPIPFCKPLLNIAWDSKTHNATILATTPLQTPWKLFNTTIWINQLMPHFSLLDNWQQDRRQFEQALATKQATSADTAISQLPLIEIPTHLSSTTPTSNTLAIIISGDGGWANIDKDIANALASKGIAVVGWNSLEYFWEEKTPDIAGKDLQGVINHYLNAWKKTKLIMIGFSMGADVMPFMVNRLDKDTQANILSVNLLNPSTSVDFVFHLSGWLQNNKEASHKLYPEVKDWKDWPSNCFYSETKESLCETIQENLGQKPDKQQLFYLPGDHHFNGNYQQLIELILKNSTAQ